MSNKHKRIIGVTAPSIFSDQVNEMISEYFDAIPLLINQDKPEDIKRVFDLCDAVVLAGGRDIHPSTIIENGESREMLRGQNYSKFDLCRDKRELELIKLSEESGKKILLICRGFQLMMVHKGFYLYPDISWSDVAHAPNGVEVESDPVHYVRCLGAAKKEFFENSLVSSFHHQAIAFVEPSEALKTGVEILGVSTLSFKTQKQAAILNIELARGDNWIGGQMHPETDWGNNVSSQIILNKFKEMMG
jgi:gamma-glutamyl-gamma-aminobutyrate hydrolase PuuD